MNNYVRRLRQYSALKISPKLSRERIQRYLRESPFRLSQRLFFRRRKIERARKLRLENLFPEAERILSDILVKQPNNVLALAECACLARDSGDLEKADRLWEAVLSHLRKPAEHYYAIVLQAVETFLASHRAAEARALIRDYAPPHKFNDAHLALANIEEDPTGWLKQVNDFFTGCGLLNIRISPDRLQSYFNLIGQPGRVIETGPKVSVIMAAFNVEKYIEVAIRSVLDQTWRNIELIVVDDCSSDSTANVVAEIANKDSRIRQIRNPVNVGPYVCRNIALDQCTGEFATTHDSDDWAHPERISHQVQDLMRNPGLFANVCHNVRMSEDGRFELTSWGVYSHRCYMSLMVRLEQVKSAVGYWDSVRVSADSEYIERIQTVKGPNSVGILPEALIITLRRENSLTTAPQTMGLTGRLSFARREYRKAYLQWHKAAKKNCKIPFPMADRKFPAPLEIIVPYPLIWQAITHNTVGKDKLESDQRT